MQSLRNIAVLLAMMEQGASIRCIWKCGVTGTVAAVGLEYEMRAGRVGKVYQIPDSRLLLLVMGTGLDSVHCNAGRCAVQWIFDGTDGENDKTRRNIAGPSMLETGPDEPEWNANLRRASVPAVHRGNRPVRRCLAQLRRNFRTLCRV